MQDSHGSTVRHTPDTFDAKRPVRDREITQVRKKRAKYNPLSETCRSIDPISTSPLTHGTH